MSGVGYLEKNKPKGQNKGVARSAHVDDPNDQDVDITYIAKDYIDLEDVLGEQLHLQIPYQPLCESTCKGICTQCGTNLNRGKCACSKVIVSPFSKLQNFKINKDWKGRLSNGSSKEKSF